MSGRTDPGAKPDPTRRRLLAAGATALVAGGTVAAAPPAQAAVGDALLIGRANSAGINSSSTVLVANSSQGHGLYVQQQGTQAGLFGQSAGGYGTVGRTESAAHHGAVGTNASTVPGTGCAVRATSAQTHGVIATVGNAERWAVMATNTGSDLAAGEPAAGGIRGVGGAYGFGVQGEGADGVVGTATSPLGFGVIANAPAGSTEGAALYARGPSILQGFTAIDRGLDTHGPVTYLDNAFLIQHPVTSTRFLQHSGVHSAERKNVYDGSVALDATGAATVVLPAYVSALNRSFCYQLTPIGVSAPDLHISQEIANDRFTIAGGVPGQKVTWQVTGVRKDRYAADHPFQVEPAFVTAQASRSAELRENREARLR